MLRFWAKKGEENVDKHGNSYSNVKVPKRFSIPRYFRNDYSSIYAIFTIVTSTQLENNNISFRKRNFITRNDQKLDQSCRLRDPVPGTRSTRTFRSRTGMSWYEKSGTLTLTGPSGIRGTNVKSQMLSFQIFTSLRAIRPFQINGAIGNERGSEGHGNHGFLVPQILTSLCPRPSPCRVYIVYTRVCIRGVRTHYYQYGGIWNLHERVFFSVFLWCRPVKGSLPVYIRWKASWSDRIINVKVDAR